MKSVVLYVGEMEFPDKNAAAQRVLANAKIIQTATEYNLVLVGLNKNKKNKTLDKCFKIDDIIVFEKKYPNTYVEWFDYIINIKYINEIVNHIGIKDVSTIIAYNYPAIALERLRVFCNKNDIEIISDVSEWYGKSERRFPSNHIKNLDTYMRMNFVNKRCENLICASKYLENYYSKKCNILNIPSLVDDENLKFQNIDCDLSNKSDLRTYSYVGSPGKSKEKDRLDWIINAFYKLKKFHYNFKLVFVGITVNSLLEYYPELNEKVKELGNDINFQGRVSHVEAIKIISESDFTLFAREINRITTAGFPTKLAESYACNTPIVTTPSSNVKDYIINGKTGYVSTFCDENSFYDSVKLSIDVNQPKVESMKEYITKNNPLMITNFIEDAEDYFNNLKRGK